MCGYTRANCEPDVNYVPVQLMRLTERPRSVRLEFAGGIVGGDFARGIRAAEG